MHLADGTKAFLAAIPDGRDGIALTLGLMARLVRAFRKHPGIIALATELTAHLPPKDTRGEITAVFEFVRDQIRYILDVRDVETIATPDRVLERGAGDCDDKATLLATLLESIGYATRFVAGGMNGGELSHVWTEVRLGDSWIALDATEPVEPGWRPPRVTIQMVQTV